MSPAKFKGLRIQDLSVRYPTAAHQALQNIHLQLHAGEVLWLMGSNGSGRSTLLKALMGMIPSTGDILWSDAQGQRNLQTCSVHQRAQTGLGYLPETRDVFASLTVEQNLLLGLGPQGKNLGVVQGSARLDPYLDLFPILRQRLHAPARVLSGGEQQVLSLCRTLLGQAPVLLLDEPTEGLSAAWTGIVAQLLTQAKRGGQSLIVVAQKADWAEQLADRCIHLKRGQLVDNL